MVLVPPVWLAASTFLISTVATGLACGYYILPQNAAAKLLMTKPVHTFWRGLWRLADPKISLASFAGLFLAACFAARDSGLHAGWFLMTVLGVFFVEVAKNASGEVVDFDSGTDLAITDEERSPFSGGKRVLVDGLLDRNQAWLIAAMCFLAAIVIGLAIVIFRDPRVLVFGLIGMSLAWCYHGAPVRLAYRGLGELAVMFAYGPVIVLGAYFVQAGVLNAILMHVSMILGILVAAFLWINQFPDYRADQASSKRNLVVRLGLSRAALAYVVMVASAYLWLGMLLLSSEAARGLWPALAGALPAFFSARRLLAYDGRVSSLIPAQAAALASFLLISLGAGLGYLLSA
jgi:1,4-dihydroxy-2-naphthoate octaprenyltransferase